MLKDSRHCSPEFAKNQSNPSAVITFASLCFHTTRLFLLSVLFSSATSFSFHQTGPMFKEFALNQSGCWFQNEISSQATTSIS